MRTSGKTNNIPDWPNLHKTSPGTEKQIKEEPKPSSLSLPHDGALFSSRLWVDVPSRLEDGFSCYDLNKIELWHWAVTLIYLRAKTRSVQAPRAVTCQGGFKVRHSKSLLWWEKEPRSIHLPDTFICISAIWGQHPSFSHLPYPHPIVLAFGGPHIWRAGITDGCDLLVYGHGRRHSITHL